MTEYSIGTIAGNAGAVVGDHIFEDEPAPDLGQGDIAGAGVQRVVDQLLQHEGRKITRLHTGFLGQGGGVEKKLPVVAAVEQNRRPVSLALAALALGRG